MCTVDKGPITNRVKKGHCRRSPRSLNPVTRKEVDNATQPFQNLLGLDPSNGCFGALGECPSGQRGYKDMPN